VELEKKIQNLEERLRRASAREIELENRISQLNAEILSSKDRGLTGQKLDIALQLQTDNERLTKEIEILKANFASAASIWKNQVSVISRKYPNDRFDLDA
jgi:chromosome segregation ATPase